MTIIRFIDEAVKDKCKKDSFGKHIESIKDISFQKITNKLLHEQKNAALPIGGPSNSEGS